jgi:adenylate cyclase
LLQSEKVILQRLNILIEKHIDGATLSVEYLCKEIGISRSQLHRILKQETQLSLSHFVRKKRLEKAEELLRNTEMRVSEISDVVGINSHQNFTNYFKSAYGMAPRDYRAQNFNGQSQIVKTEKNSIAVLPFVNLSNDKEQDYFSDGITEEIINLLSKVSALKVVGRTSSFAFKNKSEDLRAIGESLGVNHILEGSVRKVGDRVRITAQLINVTDGYQLWSQKFDSELTDIFLIQDQISASILEEVKDELLGGMSHELTQRIKRDPVAHEYYLKGLYYLNKYSKTENFRKAIDYFERAIEIEPDYAECYSEMASCYLQLWFFSQIDAAESVDKARTLINNAYQFDPDNTQLMVRDAHLKTWYNWDLKGAKNLLEAAREITPNNPELHMHLGVVMTYLREFELAEECMLKGMAIDPLSAILQFAYAFSLWYKGDFEKCEQVIDKLIEFKPRFWGGYYLKGVVFLETSRSIEALDFAYKSIDLYPSSMTYALLAQSHLLSANFKEAQDTVAMMESQIDQFPVSNFDLGHLFMGLGQFEKSRDYLQKAVEAREGRMLFLLPSCRKIKGIQSHPYYKPFFDLMKAVSKI